MKSHKSMSRSRNQLASSYAPESFFTFEGGLGACIAKSIPTRIVTLNTATQNQIFERINEMAQNWFEQALNCRNIDAGEPPVRAVQCVDHELLDTSERNYQELAFNRVALMHPSEMGYTPAPLSFMCEACKLVRTYDSVETLNKDIPVLTNKEQCPHPRPQKRCDWRQLDLVFVHWSGGWEPVRVDQNHWDSVNGRVVTRKERCTCGCTEFTLDRPTSSIGDAFFRCAKCTKPVSLKWLQNDKKSLSWIQPGPGDASRLSEVRMQVTPYRASNVYYVQGDQFIDFKGSDGNALSLLLQGREEELMTFLGERLGFAASYPPEEEIKLCVLKAGETAEWASYQSMCASINTLKGMAGTEAAIPGLKLACSNQLRTWVDRNIIKMATEVPPGIDSLIINRKTLFATKFDPIRLMVEHAALLDDKIAPNTVKGSKRLYVPFDSLDDDLSPKDIVEKDAKEKNTRNLLNQLGVQKMGLIREFDLCKFTLGYSRMESGPVLEEKRGINMPVKLNLFPKVRIEERQKNPIYVITQANEAIYVQLDPESVYAWLKTLECKDMFDLDGSGLKLGVGLLTSAFPMNRFLNRLPESDDPPIYLYAYSLLHTYAHLMMRFIAEYSGLDLGSLSEYIFPADMAFVIYRNGTTMDLGNLSAMWRNSGEAFLRSLLRPKALLCGSGSLCTHRGGACPDCLMVPETSCLAGNKLMSRSLLRGMGGKPKFDTRKSFYVKGYLDVVEDRLAGINC